MLSPQSGANVQAMIRLPVMTRTMSRQVSLPITSGSPGARNAMLHMPKSGTSPTYRERC